MIHIIDDDLYVLSMLSEVMKALGYHAATFPCPSSYCEYANSSHYHRPDIIITDVKMPTMNGYQLMRNISEIHKEVKFIVMTGYQEMKDKCFEHPHIFMQKPFNPEKIGINIQLLMNTA